MINKLKKISLSDLLGILKFILLLFPCLLGRIYLKLTREELWLICETKTTARDNGLVFYQYMRKYHPEIRCIYAIDTKCADYQKVKPYGNIVKWGSFEHYFYYMCATLNISSHKEGNPNHTLFTFLHLYLNLFNNRVFLQHGVLYQNFSMFHQQNTKFKIFITGALPEYEFVSSKFGYQNGEVKYTGLARFDNLLEGENDEKIIVYMPTWRRHLNTRDKFINSLYYQRITSFINSSQLESILEKNDKYLYFCPHAGEALNFFETKNKRVKIIDTSSADIQKLLIKASLLITDFSSIHTDFAFMKKPILYYQYDEEEYKKFHVGPASHDTYFDFTKDGFGKVIHEEEELMNNIEKMIRNNYPLEDIYRSRIENFFLLHDHNNCERTYQTLMDDDKAYYINLKQDKSNFKRFSLATRIYYRLTFNQHFYYYKMIIISRKRNYYRKKKGFIALLKRMILDIKYNRLSLKLNIFLDGEFGKNLHISHENILLNRYAKLGDNVILHGNNCIGNGNNGKKEAPVIGNGVDIGYGASLIGNIKIADDIVIGANALVNKSFLEKGIVIAGVPAKKIKDRRVDIHETN